MRATHANTHELERMAHRGAVQVEQRRQAETLRQVQESRNHWREYALRLRAGLYGVTAFSVVLLVGLLIK